MIASTSSSWPLPATPGDAEDLAGPDLEVDAVDDLAATVVRDHRPSTLSDASRRVGLAAIDDQRDLAADHQLGEVLLVRSRTGCAGRRPCRAG